MSLLRPRGRSETGMLNRFTGSAEGKASLVGELPTKRVGTPDEIAQAIVFVASDKASFMIGTPFLSMAAGLPDDTSARH